MSTLPPYALVRRRNIMLRTNIREHVLDYLYMLEMYHFHLWELVYISMQHSRQWAFWSARIVPCSQVMALIYKGHSTNHDC